MIKQWFWINNTYFQLVRAFVHVIPVSDPLGPAVMSLLLDDCPLPTRLYIYIYKVVISVCLWSDHNWETYGTDLPQILIGELWRPSVMFLAWFWDSKLSWSTLIVSPENRSSAGKRREWLLVTLAARGSQASTYL